MPIKILDNELYTYIGTHLFNIFRAMKNSVPDSRFVYMIVEQSQLLHSLEALRHKKRLPRFPDSTR